MGFSIVGTIIAFLVLFPSIIFYAKFPPKNPSMKIKEVNIVFKISERIGQALCLILLIMSGDSMKMNHINIYTIFMIVCIIVYYLLWIRYIKKGQDISLMLKPFLGVPIPGAVFPVCAFAFAALWSNNILLSIATLILGVGHFTVSWNTYKQNKL